MMGPHNPLPLLGSMAPHPEGNPAVADVLARQLVTSGHQELTRRIGAFRKKHPEVEVKPPTADFPYWSAEWPVPGRDGATEKHAHPDRAILIEYLEARFDRGDLASPGR